MPVRGKSALDAAEVLSTETLAGELKRRGVFVFVGPIHDLTRTQLPNLPRDQEVVCVIVKTSR